ncbi:MAG: hypothetical protein QXN08_06855 [Nitrososphaerales archaeon]
MKIYTYTALAILILASVLTFLPNVYSAQATAAFNLSDGLIKVEVTSPVEVYQFQLSITLPSGATINAAQASTTGFMENAVFLQVGNEYRWFNLDAKPSKVGSLTVPASGVGVDNLPQLQLVRLDLLDAGGNKIDLQQTLPLKATLAPITVTTTVRETITTTTTVTQTTTRTTTVTQPTTTTLTSTITQPTTITTTSTVTQPTTVTITVTSTTTQPTTVTATSTTTATEVKTTTQTTTSTSTYTITRTELATTTAYKEITVDTTPYIAGIVILIIIIIILAILMLRRKAAV